MSQPYIIGLTGGIGAGKSTCTAVAVENGFPVFDADAESHKIWQNREFVTAVEQFFGPLGENPKATVAAQVAENAALLDSLYAVMAPMLKFSFQTFLYENRNAPIVVLDAPLLLEKDWDKECDSVVVIMVPEDVRLQRVLSRPGMTREKFQAIVTKQVSDDERRSRATDLIDGTAPVEVVTARFLEILRAYQ